MARTPPARTAGQRPLIALVATVVLAVGVNDLASNWDELTGSVDTVSPIAGEGQGQQPQGVPEAGRTAEVVGPARGELLADYVADRRQALLDAPDSVDVAIVSFDERLLLEDALLLLGDAVEVRAVLLQLPLSTATPLAVRVSQDPVSEVEDAVERAVAPLASEEDETRQLLDSGSVDDEDFLAEYRQRLAELEAARRAAQGGVPLVHAVVVQGPLAELRLLLDATAVRLVDPAPPATDPAVSVFHGLLPEDAEVASAGRAP